MRRIVPIVKAAKGRRCRGRRLPGWVRNLIDIDDVVEDDHCIETRVCRGHFQPQRIWSGCGTKGQPINAAIFVIDGSMFE